MDKISAARARFGLKEVFFATILYSTPSHADKTIPTACTDMKSIRYNPDFLDSLDMDTIMFVWAHEVLHIAFKHGLRMAGRNPMLWNIACDYAINLMLKENGFKLWQDSNGKLLCLYDEKYKGMSAEQIYDSLQKEMEQNRKKGRGPSSPDQLPKDGMHGDVQEPGGGNMDADTRAQIERSIEQRVAQAAQMSRMAGKLAGNLARMVDEILNPKVPWQEVLREYVCRVVHHDESWSRRNRRFQNVYLPARWSEKLGTVGLIGDTSGSIGNDELKAYTSEASYIFDNMQPERTVLLWADTRTAGIQTFEQGDAFVPEPKGGGGTDMRVPLVDMLQHQPDVCILFTDGFTPWPDVEPEYPLIVCCTTDAPVPVGHVIRI
jgi:predicted metal-dependent peptidase